jgi:hypothetical protein
VSRTYIALLDDEPKDADVTVVGQLRDGSDLVLAAWHTDRRPHPRATSVDPRILGAGGPAMAASWTELPEGRRPLFDAPEVLQARRRLIRSWPAYGVSALVTDSVHLAGSVLLWAGGPLFDDDPFARLGPSRVVSSQGFFVPLPAPTGPALERYGGAPWPFDRFATT